MKKIVIEASRPRNPLLVPSLLKSGAGRHGKSNKAKRALDRRQLQRDLRAY